MNSRSFLPGVKITGKWRAEGKIVRDKMDLSNAVVGLVCIIYCFRHEKYSVWTKCRRSGIFDFSMIGKTLFFFFVTFGNVFKECDY